MNLPPGWEWTTLGEVAESVKNGIFVSRPGIEPDGVPILRISAVRPLALSINDVRYSAKSVDELEAADALVEGGDLLFTRYSGSRDFVGVCARAPEGLGDLTYPDKLIRARLPADIDSKYVAYAFASPGVRSRVEAVLRTTAGQVGIAGRELKRVTFPLAPLPEQRRVVAILDEHLATLGSGTASLTAAHTRVKRLENAVAEDALRRLEDVPRSQMGESLREPLRNGFSGRTTQSKDGVRTLTLSAVTQGEFSDRNTKIADVGNRNVESLWLADGDVLIQ